MRQGTRSFLQLTRTLHIYLTMFASVVLILFALTGFMLNHRSWFGLQGRPSGPQRPAVVQRSADPPSQGHRGRGAERPAQKPRLLATLTNLHKGKPPRLPATLLVDVTAVVLMLGALTGIILLLSLPRRRRWGLVVMGAGTLLGLSIYLLAFP